MSARTVLGIRIGPHPRRGALVLGAIAALGLAACGDDPAASTPGAGNGGASQQSAAGGAPDAGNSAGASAAGSSSKAQPKSVEQLAKEENQAPREYGRAIARATELQTATLRWAAAEDLATAKREAATARGLVTGAHVQNLPGSASTAPKVPEMGLLPGDDGEPGIASTLDGRCVVQDVLGGSWKDPAARWDDVRRRIDSWRESRNTFPELQSHAQRVVGWASLALQTDDVAKAREYATHAAGHAGVVLQALQDPDARSCPGG